MKHPSVRPVACGVGDGRLEKIIESIARRLRCDVTNLLVVRSRLKSPSSMGSSVPVKKSTPSFLHQWWGLRGGLILRGNYTIYPKLSVHDLSPNSPQALCVPKLGSTGSMGVPGSNSRWQVSECSV